jgi:AcrR family transcriptional regulator
MPSISSFLIALETNDTKLVSNVYRAPESMERKRKSLKRTRPADSGRQRIVEAARAHFFSHGFRRVTMDDLAAELAISKKTLYAYFPSKTALLEDVLADKFASVGAALEQVTREHAHDFSGSLHQLLATAQQQLDEIKPPFVRDMRQKAPHVFKMVERRRADLIQRHFGKLFTAGQRAGKVRKDIPAKLIIEILLGAVQAIMNPPKIEELGLTPKGGFVAITKVVLEGALVHDRGL